MYINTVLDQPLLTPECHYYTDDNNIHSLLFTHWRSTEVSHHLIFKTMYIDVR